MDSQEQALTNDERRLEKTLDSLYEVHNVGLEDTARFLASELGVSTWFVPERIPHG